MSQNSELEISVGDLIPSPTTQYQAQTILGNGVYGVVIQCRNVTTDETEEEVTLQAMKALHSDRFNIVRFNESFTYKGHYCLVFEHLDMDLQKFKQISPGQHLQLKQIRPILQQLATSLEFLNSAGIIHADLKPDNIMLVDHVRKPLKVKVIDFGLAFDDPEEQIGDLLQPLWYRSPEVLYKEPFSGAIDVWSLGCIAAELSTGRPLFPASNENELMRQFAFAIRDPEHEGNFLPHAFWPRRWMEARFMGTHPLWVEEVQAEHCDLQCFLDLMTQMLMMSQLRRITPSRILQHPFITMSHLQGSYRNSLYAKSCKDLMDICQDPSSDDGGHGDQVILQMSLNEDASSSTASPAKERSPAGMTDEKHSKMNAKRGNRPEDSQAMVRRSERLAAIRGTSGQTGPIRCQRRRKRHNPTANGNPSTKKTNVSLRNGRTL
ncbi:homeodomain-interacting protein kinase 3-like [Hippoglossus stenolepis]|uniref:homeodomain-interacting protein kinase 3-like n=1 Tax=Hippoglossus stenolepis TaxID=195615 RepID=UPI001FAFBE4A|nr:homeodomain-interacting protein kinase 3-like [Hippoglossus stenolepis]